MKCERLTIEGKNLDTLIYDLKEKFSPSYVCTSYSGNVILLVFEKFYFRQKSDLSGILMIDFENDNRCMINIVVAGGKSGLMRLDPFRAENSQLKRIREFIYKMADDKRWRII